MIIKNKAFSGTNLTSLTIPSNVQTIGDSAFGGCKNLTNLVIENGVTTVEQYAFSGIGVTSLVVPSSMETLSYCVFADCDNLVEVELSNGVVTIGEKAFYWCENLKKIKFSSTVTTIGTNAFSMCTGLTSIYLPSTITSVAQGNYRYSPFLGCSSTLVIYCERTSSEGPNFVYGLFWNSYVTDGNCDPWDNKNILTVKAGYSYQQYLNAIGG